MTILQFKEYKDMRDNKLKENTANQNTMPNTPLQLRGGGTLDGIVNGKVLMKDTEFTKNCQEKLRLAMKRPDIEMKLMALPKEHTEEDYVVIEYKYLIFDSKTSEVILNSLSIEDYSTFCISEMDNDYLNANGYSLKVIISTVLEVLINSSTKLSTLDKEHLLSTI